MGQQEGKITSETTRHVHDIPSLDGLRAVSIGIVVLSHTRALLPARVVNSGLFRYVVGGGLHGVQIFFVLSGYLITTLLLRELGRTGEVSFRRFYARRVMRIFPAFYTYFAVIALLCLAGAIALDWPTYAASATYAFVYKPHPKGWYVEHAWSLSVEEQFYLLWPAALVIAHRRGWSAQVVASLLAVMPLVRVLLWLTVPGPERAIVSSGSVDTLMAGCLLALMTNRGTWERFQSRFLRGWVVAALLAVGFVVVPYASAKVEHSVPGALVIAVGTTVTALAIAATVAYVVEQPRSVVGQMLNLRLLRHLGVISYSIYLWQELFTADPRRFGFAVYLWVLAAGEMSFWLIERPVMRLRTRWGW